jgi:hypothetical protein
MERRHFSAPPWPRHRLHGDELFMGRTGAGCRNARSRATAEKRPKSEYFIIDVQTHFTNGAALAFRNTEFVKNMGYSLKNDADSYAFPNMVKEMFFDSETSLIVISGVPGKENTRGEDGKVLVECPQTLVVSCRVVSAREELNDRPAASEPCARNCLNHYWDKRQCLTTGCSSRWKHRSSLRHRLMEVVLPRPAAPAAASS